MQTEQKVDIANIELTEEYQEIGETIQSEKLRQLLMALSEMPNLLFTSNNNAVTADIYGEFKIQVIGSEDRLLFKQNQSHVHVCWSQLKRAVLIRHKKWVGVELCDEERALCSFWVLAGKDEFPQQVIDLLGDLRSS